MPQVAPLGQLNLASLKNNDVYILIATPANTFVQGVQTGIVGIVGTASWGPKNVPVAVPDPTTGINTWGAPRIAPNDMPTDITILQQLGVPLVYTVRVSDGTDATATNTLLTAAKGTVTLAGVYHIGDVITVTVGGVATSYTVTAADATLAGAAASLANAMNTNAAFANIASTQVNGAVVTVITQSALNTTTLTAAVTGAGATITATASGATLAGGGLTMGVFNALWTGLDGNSIVPSFVPNTKSTGAAPLWDLSLSISHGGLSAQSEVFTALPEATMSAAIVNALQNGQGPSRGPSVIARFTTGAQASGSPVGGAQVMAGGLNGDTALTSSQQLGTPFALPATGMYALVGTGVQKLGLCGNTDTSIWTTLLTFALQIGAGVALCYPPNTTTAAAIALKASVGVDSYAGWLFKDWVQYLDTVNGQYRLVSPMPFALGRIASLTPEQSPGNKTIGLVKATERTLANSPYSPAEMGVLTAAGINFITNQCPGGTFFGLRHGLNSSSNSAIADIPYTNVTNFLAYSFAGSFGEFIEQNQTTRSDDPIRAAASQKLSKFLLKLKKNGTIEDYSVDMSYSDTGSATNTRDSVTSGFMNAIVRVQYKSVIRFFVVTLIGGKTVNVSIQ